MLREAALGLLVLVCLISSGLSAQAQVVIERVTVGNPDNTGEQSRLVDYGDETYYGGVDYVYNIGKLEITAGQYTGFLNAVGATDTYGLYNPSMDSDVYGCKIVQTGSSPNYSYSVAPDWADRPVNYVSWGDAARFANWLHNGQPTGPQDLSTTEDGSYYLNGATSGSELMAIVREEDATWVIPSEDEWYKAAYHCNDGVTGNYWDYPTGSNTPPTSEAPPGTDMTNGSANYYDYETGFAIGYPYYQTEVGAYDAKPSDSPYGTFDQGGNVWEWNETAVDGSLRGLRGGSVHRESYPLHAADRGRLSPTREYHSHGFRVADVSGECGNGIVEYGEACDDGNEDETDFCLSTCQLRSSIPTVSEWGLLAMTLLVLSAGTVVLMRRRAIATPSAC